MVEITFSKKERAIKFKNFLDGFALEYNSRSTVVECNYDDVKFLHGAIHDFLIPEDTHPLIGNS
ncbi:MAG: hypothetical protein SFT91_06415 [Rickettsiaceae bacterium]|nr:hypothetical protein [Rickettsiaceae bacterium]